MKQLDKEPEVSKSGFSSKKKEKKPYKLQYWFKWNILRESGRWVTKGRYTTEERALQALNQCKKGVSFWRPKFNERYERYRILKNNKVIFED